MVESKGQEMVENTRGSRVLGIQKDEFVEGDSLGTLNGGYLTSS